MEHAKRLTRGSSLVAAVLAVACGNEPTTEGPSEPFDADRTYEGWLGSDLGEPVVTGTNVDKTDEFTPDCAPSTTGDVSYTWTAPASAAYRFDTFGSNFNTVLHIRSFTDTSEVLGCNNNHSGTEQSSMGLDLDEGTTVVIVIDGFADATGDFDLNISEIPCPGGCLEPLSQCHAEGICMEDPWGNYCYYPELIQGTPCDDGLECTIASSCVAGSCVPDWVGCTDPPSDCHEPFGSCGPTGACEYDPLPAGDPCDDDMSCTDDDVCDGAGNCEGDSTCEPDEVCTGEGCEPSPCPDGCQVPPSQCHLPGECVQDPFLGDYYCVFPETFPGTPCDDGLECTPSSSCYEGSCVPDSFGCFDPPGDCYEPVGGCAGPAGECEYYPKDAGEACDDGLTCTVGDSCDGAGICEEGATDCPAGQICTEEGCQPEPSECGPTLEDCGDQGCCKPGSGCTICLQVADEFPVRKRPTLEPWG